MPLNILKLLALPVLGKRLHIPRICALQSGVKRHDVGDLPSMPSGKIKIKKYLYMYIIYIERKSACKKSQLCKMLTKK